MCVSEMFKNPKNINNHTKNISQKAKWRKTEEGRLANWRIVGVQGLKKETPASQNALKGERERERKVSAKMHHYNISEHQRLKKGF